MSWIKLVQNSLSYFPFLSVTIQRKICDTRSRFGTVKLRRPLVSLMKPEVLRIPIVLGKGGI